MRTFVHIVRVLTVVAILAGALLLAALAWRGLWLPDPADDDEEPASFHVEHVAS